MTTSADAGSRSHPRRKRVILVGVDGSDGATAALLFAAELAGDLVDAQVVVVHGTYSSPQVRPSSEQFESWCAPLRAMGITYRTVVEAADAVPLILEVAGREDADMVVVGATAHSELAEVVLGGIGVELAHHGRRPLVVVPALAGSDGRG